MKSILWGIFANISTLSIILYIASIYIEKNILITLFLFISIIFIVPFIGAIINASTQKKYDILLSTILLSFLSSIIAIIPVEIFKVYSGIKAILNNEMLFSNSSSSIQLEIDTSFNIANYITPMLIWILIATITSFIFRKIRKPT